MSINIQECSNIETNILELNVSILKYYLNDKQYDELDKEFLITNILKNLNLEQLCSEYDFFKDREHNFLLDKIHDLTKFKISFRSFFKKTNKIEELAQVIKIINENYGVKTISLFETILFSYNISEKEKTTKKIKLSEETKYLTKLFEEESFKLNQNTIITINDFFKKMFIDFYMYSYLCGGNYRVDNEIIKKVNNLIYKYYFLTRIEQEFDFSNLNILIEPYGVSSIYSIKIINYLLYLMFKYNKLNIFLASIDKYKELFEEKFLTFLNDRRIINEIENIKKKDDSVIKLAEFIFTQYKNNKLPLIEVRAVFLFNFLNNNKNEYRIFRDAFQKLKIPVSYFDDNIEKYFEQNIILLALNLVIYNYYYNYNNIDENVIDTYINYIKYLGNYIITQTENYEKNSINGRYLSKINFREVKKEETGDLIKSNVRQKLGKILSTISDEEEQIKILLLQLKDSNSFDLYNINIIKIQSLLDTFKDNNQTELFNKYNNELEKIKKIIEYYGIINKIKSKEELENLKIILEKEKVFDVKLIQSIYLKKEDNLIKFDQIKSSLSEIEQILELSKEIRMKSQIKSKKKLRKRVKLGKTLSNEEETKTKDKELSKSIQSPKKRHLTRSFDSYNKKSSFKTNSLNSKKPLTDSFKKELEEIKQIEKILNILKNTDSIDDYNKYLNELLQILKLANEKINKRYKEKIKDIYFILNLYNSIKTIKFKDTLETFKRYLTRINLIDNLLLNKIINDVELNLKDKSELFKLSVEELKKEIFRHNLDKKKIKELEDIIKDKELLVNISTPRERHQTKSLDRYNKKSSFKTNSLNSKKSLTKSFEKELEEIEKILNILKNTVSIDDYNKYLDELKKILDFFKIRDLELYKKYNIELQQIKKTILYYNKLNNISTKEELEELKKELKLNEIYNFKLIETKYNELSEYIDLVTKILKDKLYRLVNYTRLKINNLSIIYKSYEKTFDELKYIKEIIGSVENNSKKISDLSKLMLAYNKKYNINYYNYGSEASLLLLLIPNVTLKEIRYYVDEYKSEYKNKQIALQKKYALSDYLNKIGYDLAICQYVFTDISFIFSKEQFDKIINIILHHAYDIMDKYIIEVNNYYSKIMNLESISNSNIKKQTKKEQIEKIFNNDLYKEQKEQLKYNLYLYKYKQFPNKPTAVLLWFINTVVLRFSDI